MSTLIRGKQRGEMLAVSTSCLTAGWPCDAFVGVRITYGALGDVGQLLTGRSAGGEEGGRAGQGLTGAAGPDEMGPRSPEACPRLGTTYDDSSCSATGWLPVAPESRRRWSSERGKGETVAGRAGLTPEYCDETLWPTRRRRGRVPSGARP